MAKVQCPRCDKEYPANDTVGHCSGCHETFNGLGAFDKHRREGTCLDPSKHTEPGKFWLNDRGVWSHGRRMSADKRESLRKLRDST